MDSDDRMASLRQLHREINRNVDTMKERASQLLEDQESDLVRAFRARLYTVKEELTRERSSKDDGMQTWIKRENDIARELELMKCNADRNDRMNQMLQKENEQLRTEA
eukprot:1744429-Prorocentrum_lima.AAC.1